MLVLTVGSSSQSWAYQPYFQVIYLSDVIEGGSSVVPLNCDLYQQTKEQFGICARYVFNISLPEMCLVERSTCRLD